MPGPIRNTAEELAQLHSSEARLRATETAIRKILASDSSIPGPLFMAHMTRELAAAAGASFALIGELTGPKCSSIQTLSFFGDGRHHDNFEYDLLHTPCEEVIGQSACCYPANAANLFPRDRALRDLGIEGYIGIPLFDSHNAPVGILVALYRQPVVEAQHTMSILQLFATRIAGEIERGRSEERLKKQARLERLITDLSSEFIRLPAAELDDAINRALGRIGEFADADRSYIFRFHENAPRTADNTHEWCRQGIKPFIHALQNISFAGDYEWFGERIVKRESIVIPSVAALPAAARKFRELLQGQDILSLVCVPLVAEDRLLGFLGVDFVQYSSDWPAEHTPLLRIIGEIITNAQERTRREVQLRESNLRMKLALEGAEMGMYDWNILTGELTHDERWASMLEYSLNDIARDISAWENMVHPDDLPQVKKLLAAHLDDQSSIYESEHRIKARSGNWIWVMDKGKVVERKPNGQPVRMTGTHMDITKRKKAEEATRNLEVQFRHAQKLESLGVLAGGIAHDFNNLLMVILGNADLALGQLSPIAPARDCIKEIEAASRRAADLCNQMLAYSGKSQVLTTDLDLTALVREMSHMLEVSISKKAKLDYRFADDIPPVEGDSSQIGQVVMNLITNASEALDDGVGTITVSTGTMNCNGAFLRENYTDESVPEGEYVYLEVTDTGHGMDQSVLSRLFDPFFTTKFTGRGLGLSAVLGIVRSHRGALKIRSAEGQGSTFLVLFPACRIESGLQTPATDPIVTGSPDVGTVLVVDDEEPVRDVAGRMLRALGFDVILAANGREGLELFDTHRERLRCVLLDRTMPDMDGDKVLERIREIDPEMLVIQVSGYGQRENNSDPFIQKPFTLTDLENKLADLL
ncbi:MAG: PAS domain-containing protein [Acidobacteria bacterium]|uniref:histidine kinase n=1 Tax=Candidatus Polarisedimenticola svalbardensis TaxID=2886004 RepID=A0A8J6XXZ6_9BACT|nr:PAS domain-containing protein [Candidatus Polarisedimenticola svalbardensis]